MFIKDGDSERNAMWNDKDKFSLFRKVSINDVESELKSFNIQDMVIFDEAGTDLSSMKIFDNLTLLTLPILNEVNDTAKQTNASLRAAKLRVRAIYYTIDISTELSYRQEGGVMYFPTKNLVLPLFNPFADEKIWSHFKDMVTKLKPELKDKKAIIIEEFTAQFMKRIDFQITKYEDKQKDTISEIKSYRDSYIRHVKRERDYDRIVKSLKANKVDGGKAVSEELAKVEKMQILKEFSFNDGICFSFGNVYCNHKVKTGIKKVDGIATPLMEKRKVFIGDLKFKIKDNRVTLTNSNAIGRYPHPHAKGDSICFGEVDLKIKEFLETFQLVKLITLLYSWASSFNSEDAYLPLQAFYDKETKDNFDPEGYDGE